MIGAGPGEGARWRNIEPVSQVYAEAGSYSFIGHAISRQL